MPAAAPTRFVATFDTAADATSALNRLVIIAGDRPVFVGRIVLSGLYVTPRIAWVKRAASAAGTYQQTIVLMDGRGSTAPHATAYYSTTTGDVTLTGAEIVQPVLVGDGNAVAMGASVTVIDYEPGEFMIAPGQAVAITCPAEASAILAGAIYFSEQQ
jgi:hypothetical protein